MAEVYRNENIDIYTLSEVIDVDGHVGDFKIRIRRKPRYVDVERCTACNICYEKCPSRVPDDYHHGLGFRKAIYIPYKQAIPRAYRIDAQSCLYFEKGVCRICEKFCPAKAINFDDEEEEFDVRVGAIIVATGFKEFDPSKIPEYGYGKYKDVLTNMQLTSLMHPDGPTSGRLTRPSDGREADDIVFIQCVGSRDERFHRYCSRVCCMASLKLAYLIKSEKNPAANIYICYIDLRAYGKGFEEYLERVKSMGVKLVRGKPSEVTLDESSGKLLVRVYDTVLNEYLDIRADIVSLAAAIEPSDGSRELAKILGIDIGPDGFYKELHPKLEPVSTKVRGIYVCGAGWGPADIPESVTMAKAAASESASLLSKGHVKIPLTIASVDVDRCDGCGICVDSCSYGAVELKEFDGGKLAVVNELACSGCGSCASACPTGAIELRHYRHEQILRQIEGMLGVVE
jgi:heterodisulfide reductase subunit A